MVFESRPFRIMFVLRVIRILQNKRDDAREVQRETQREGWRERGDIYFYFYRYIDIDD